MTQTGTKLQPEMTPHMPGEAPPTTEFPAAGAREQSLARLQLLWEKRGFLLRVAGYGLLSATLIAFLIPNRYEATARLVPPDNQANSGMALLAMLSSKAGPGLGAVAGDLMGVKTPGSLFVGILGSRTVQDRLIERLDLRRVYGMRLWEDARRKLTDNTTILEDRKSGIIKITATDRSAPRAAAIGQTYVDELNRLVAELSTSAAHREREFLEGRLKSIKEELDSSAKEFSEFASKNAAIDIKEQGKAMVDAAAALQGQLIAAQAELEGLKQIYTENNVRVRSTKARIAELQKQLEKLSGGSEASGTAAKAQGGDSLYPSIRKLPLLGVTYADLYRRIKIQETVFELLTQQYELAKVQEAKETPSVKLLDPAGVPERKSFPPRLLILFLGTSLALAGGAVWVLGRARWDRTDPSDPGKIFAREVFQTVNASMPWASPNGSRFQGMTHRVWVRLVRREDSGKQAE